MSLSVPAVVAIGAVVAAKFGLPLLFLRAPFAAGWANFVLDSVDGDLLVPLGLPDPLYQTIDKSSDWVTYAMIVAAAYRGGWPIRRLCLALFLFRSIGQIGFLVTKEELFLAAFPNFLEPVFLVAVSIHAFQRTVRRRADWREHGFELLARHRLPIGAAIVVYKLQDEYFTHVANVDRSELIQRFLEGLRGG
ncbi:MAG: hypothetical protein RL338_989 [Chloroflexota bacterium]|jgi:hypothetical protein